MSVDRFPVFSKGYFSLFVRSPPKKPKLNNLAPVASLNCLSGIIQSYLLGIGEHGPREDFGVGLLWPMTF